MNIWDILIYIGGGIIFIWLVWNIFSGRKVKVKEAISVPEVKKRMWTPGKGLSGVAKSQQLNRRLSLLKERMTKEREIIKTSAEVLEERNKKKFLEEFERELKRR